MTDKLKTKHLEPCLVKAVGDLLTNAGLSKEVIHNFYTHVWIKAALEPHEKGADFQRFMLNRFWSYQLISLPVNTVDERYCLVPNGEIKHWLDLFEKKILPVCVENRLPVNLQVA